MNLNQWCHQSFYKRLTNQYMRRLSLSNNQQSEERSFWESSEHLNDRIEEQEKTKETLKTGLISFLKHVEKVENEKLHRKG